MKCAYCGKEIDLDSSYCPRCGKEIQLVAEPVFEEDLLRNLLEEEADHKASEKKEQEHDRAQQQNGQTPPANSPRKQENLNEHIAEVRRQREEQEQKKQKKRKSAKEKFLNIALAGVSVAVIVAIIVAVKAKNDYDHAHSFDYQYQMAQEAQEQGNRAAAMTYYQNALALNNKSIDVRLQLVTLYRKKNQTKEAIDLLEEILTLDKDNVEAYKNLIDIYASEEDYDSILALKSMADTNNTELQALFDNYTVDAPVYLLEEGTYNEDIMVGIDANINDTILYTMDGSDPAEHGEQYQTPIKLEKEGTYIISAVAVDPHGFVSEKSVSYYKIDYDAPSHETSETSSPSTGMVNSGEDR